MVYSKANLTVGLVASRDSSNVALNAIRLNGDGSTVATNERVICAVGPLDTQRIRMPDVGPQASPGDSGVSVSLDDLSRVEKTLPKDRHPQLQCVAMTKPRNPDEVTLTTTDLVRKQHVDIHPVNEPFPDWQNLFRGLAAGSGVKLCLNRTDLLLALATLDKACPDRGTTDCVFIEINPEATGLIMRCHNRETNQRAIAAMRAQNTNGQWLPCDMWERSVLGKKAATKKLP